LSEIPPPLPPGGDFSSARAQSPDVIRAVSDAFGGPRDIPPALSHPDFLLRKLRLLTDELDTNRAGARGFVRTSRATDPDKPFPAKGARKRSSDRPPARAAAPGPPVPAAGFPGSFARGRAALPHPAAAT